MRRLAPQSLDYGPPPGKGRVRVTPCADGVEITVQKRTMSAVVEIVAFALLLPVLAIAAIPAEDQWTRWGFHFWRNGTLARVVSAALILVLLARLVLVIRELHTPAVLSLRSGQFVAECPGTRRTRWLRLAQADIISASVSVARDVDSLIIVCRDGREISLLSGYERNDLVQTAGALTQVLAPTSLEA